MAIELSYINTKHPDFTEAHLVHRAMTDGLPQDMRNINLQTAKGIVVQEERVSLVLRFRS